MSTKFNVRRTMSGNVRLTLFAFMTVLMGIPADQSFADDMTVHFYYDRRDNFYITQDGVSFNMLPDQFRPYMQEYDEIFFISKREVCMKGHRYEINNYENPAVSFLSEMSESYDGTEAYQKFIELCGD
jgi:hypothetical protein